MLRIRLRKYLFDLNPLRHSKLALKDDFFHGTRYSGWRNTWDFDGNADADADANPETLIKLLKVATSSNLTARNLGKAAGYNLGRGLYHW